MEIVICVALVVMAICEVFSTVSARNARQLTDELVLLQKSFINLQEVHNKETSMMNSNLEKVNNNFLYLATEVDDLRKIVGGASSKPKKKVNNGKKNNKANAQ